ncbi:MAG: dihydrofolate reductase family protein [Clostridia bacterium]|nr:dihydrofolate reductase family protein [Clostridia bacterium]
MNKPYVICHMTTSIDGKVTGDFLYRPECEKAIDIYYEINRAYKADGYACGRVTMEGSFTGGAKADLSKISGSADENFDDFIADPAATFFAVAFDRKGTLGWKTSSISDEDPGYDNAHIIEVLSKDTSPAYLEYLRKTKISYIFAGNDDIDIDIALKKLYSLFGMKKLLLEGGSIINGAFQRADAIDELSLVVAPVIADKDSKPLFCDGTIKDFKLKGVTNYPNSVIWLNYVKK